MKKYEILYHYGDTGFEENLSGEVFTDLELAKRRARQLDDHIDVEDYELGDYYYVKEVK